jgi:diguanylate cyclase (GGDEF)-like protein
MSSEMITKAEQLARQSQVVSLWSTCREVIDLFGQDPDLLSLPVLDEFRRPVGLLRRSLTLARATEPYFMDLYSRRQCAFLMDSDPLCFDADVSLQAMSEQASSLRESHVSDGFIVTRCGEYLGTGRVTDLLKAVSEQQLRLARYANPLTLLPGNVPIDQRIDLLLSRDEDFVVAYFDIDYFKPFNDVYGYKRGDEVIQTCARVIWDALDHERDFLGHIGGDDFIAIMQSARWERSVQSVLDAFDEALLGFLDEKDRQARGYQSLDRVGQSVFHPICALSVGVVVVEPGQFTSHVHLASTASDAKKCAKKMPGSAYFVERRQPGKQTPSVESRPRVGWK